MLQKLSNSSSILQKCEVQKNLGIEIPYLELKRNLIPYPKTRPKCAQNLYDFKGQCDCGAILGNVFNF
jgi:hypothetical protein